MTLVLDHIGLSIGEEVMIDDVSLTLKRGTMNVLLGPTLAGKTTLMPLMAGLDKPSTGRIFADGKDAADLPVRRRSVAMVDQLFVNYPALSVYENIASPLRVAGLASAEIDARVEEAARFPRLENLLQRMPAQLSGGQKQRTAIARALVKRAELVLLDEPLDNLDYKLREELPRIFAQTGAIMVYATTEPAEAFLLGGMTATLREGRITQIGPTAQAYRRPNYIDAARVFPIHHSTNFRSPRRARSSSSRTVAICLRSALCRDRLMARIASRRMLRPRFRLAQLPRSSKRSGGR